MAKQSGLGDRLFVGGYNLSGDVGSLGAIGGGPQAQEVTAIDKSAKERIGLQRDGRIEFSSWFNPAASAEHDVLSVLPTTDVAVSYFRGAAVGNEAASMWAKQINYDAKRDDKGGLEWSVEAQANGYGLEWGRQLTAGVRADTVATNGASIDAGAASTNGLTWWLQVFSSNATLANIELHSSSDNGVGDPFAVVPGCTVAFVGVGTPNAVRITAAGNIERYLRVVSQGVFTDLTFASAVSRRTVATVF